MMNLEQTIAKTFLQMAEGLETGSFGAKPKIALTGMGSEHGEKNAMEAALMAAKKGETELVLGNILGSNIFNICVVLGIPVAIFGAVTPGAFSVIDLVALVGSAALLFIFSVTNHKINRIEGGLMLLMFATYYTLVFIA